MCFFCFPIFCNISILFWVGRSGIGGFQKSKKMGNQPTKLDATCETSIRLKHSVDESCLKAAKALKEGDILLVCIGDSLSNMSTTLVGWDVSNIEKFYGHWGNQFNNTRKEPISDALDIIDQWRNMYNGTEADKELQEELLGETDVASWQNKLKNDVSVDNLIDLVTDNGESDDEEMANLQFESFSPDKPGAFYAFTSCQNGQVAKLWGRSAVIECRGSIQQWQCGAEDGPCRDQDVWEVPDGFSFMLSEEDGSLVAPTGLPKSRPPVFKVNMHNPICMDRALSVAAAFRTNHPICRSCSQPARPAMSLIPGDCDWVDVRERSLKYSQWRRAVSKAKRKVVVLEIGGSPNRDSKKASHLLWTTVRQESESIVNDINSHEQSTATLIRVNEEFPLVDRPDTDIGKATISIMLPTEEALRKIDAYLKEM